MKVLVCGDRDYKDREKLRDFLGYFHGVYGITKLIHGYARGADIMAGNWAEEQEIPVSKYPAQWTVHGKAAGSIRNRQMFDTEKPDIVIAFHNNITESKGTLDMLEYAFSKDCETWLVEEDSHRLAWPR